MSENAKAHTIFMPYIKKTKLSLTHTICKAQALDGKGSCDRKASHIKSAIKRDINEEKKYVLDAWPMEKVKRNQFVEY